MASEKSLVLSKSTFIRGMQCEKSLYLHKFQPDLRDKLSESQSALFKRGHEVGRLARMLFPGGVEVQVNDFNYQDAAIRTAELINNGTNVIYEAVFEHNQVLAIADILIKDNGNWKCIEVKSSTEVKSVHILDAALQYFVVNSIGIVLNDISILYINNKYSRAGQVDVANLFLEQSVKKEALEQQQSVSEKIAELKSLMVEGRLPKKDIGGHCEDPYSCDFMGHCWKHIPKVSIFNLSRLSMSKKTELYISGIIEFSQLHPDYKLSEAQKMQVDSYLNKKDFIDTAAIKQFIGGITYPIYFMDFESFQSPVPLFENSRPYQQIPFQFSVHYKVAQGSEPLHTEFLAESSGDPRENFIISLLKTTEKSGTILAYNMTFEVTRLKELCNDFPQYKSDIEERIGRIQDLMIPFFKRWYYTSAMNGSYSIKAVLPALVPELNYDNLEIGDGVTASAAFLDLFENTDENIINQVRTNLKEYCKMDTYAMVLLMEKLENLI